MLHVEEQSLKQIREKIYALGSEVVKANELSYSALNENNRDELSNIMLSSKKLLASSNEIDNMIVKVLALYSPEAKDLRNLVAYLKITNEFVRAGTNTRAFLKSFASNFDDVLMHSGILEYTVKLQKSAFEALKQATDMIVESDENSLEDLFRTVSVEESKTDDLYSMIEKDVLKSISRDSELPGQCFDVLSSLRRLEKVADRAFSIANLLMFAKNGGDIHSNQ
jgi:phosphate transport system protein